MACVFARDQSRVRERGGIRRKKKGGKKKGPKVKKESSPRYDGLAKPSTVPARLL